MYRDDLDEFGQRQWRDYEDQLAYWRAAHARRRWQIGICIAVCVGLIVGGILWSFLQAPRMSF